MTQERAPRRVSDAVHHIDLGGYVFGFRAGRPVFTTLAGTTDYFLLVFSTKAKMVETMDALCLVYDSIKQIDDPLEFADSVLSRGIRIAIDAARVGDKCRFLEPIVQ
jgi:hypothetical protein